MGVRTLAELVQQVRPGVDGARPRIGACASIGAVGIAADRRIRRQLALARQFSGPGRLRFAHQPPVGAGTAGLVAQAGRTRQRKLAPVEEEAHPEEGRDLALGLADVGLDDDVPSPGPHYRHVDRRPDAVGRFLRSAAAVEAGQPEIGVAQPVAGDPDRLGKAAAVSEAGFRLLAERPFRACNRE